MPANAWLRKQRAALYMIQHDGAQLVVRGSQQYLQEIAEGLKRIGYTGVPNDPKTCNVFDLVRGTFTRLPAFRDHWKDSGDWRQVSAPQLELVLLVGKEPAVEHT